MCGHPIINGVHPSFEVLPVLIPVLKVESQAVTVNDYLWWKASWWSKPSRQGKDKWIMMWSIIAKIAFETGEDLGIMFVPLRLMGSQKREIDTC